MKTERTIDKGLDPKAVNPKQAQTVADIIDLHIHDIAEVGKVIRRSKRAVLESPKIALGAISYKT